MSTTLSGGQFGGYTIDDEGVVEPPDGVVDEAEGAREADGELTVTDADGAGWRYALPDGVFVGMA